MKKKTIPLTQQLNDFRNKYYHVLCNADCEGRCQECPADKLLEIIEQLGKVG